MENCIFCKIVNGKVPSYKIWEDDKFVAFLDIFPNIKGQTLVIPKEHHQSDAFKVDEKVFDELMAAIRKVARLLEKQLKVGRVHLVLEGMGVNHLHAKLYPAIGLEQKDFSAVEAGERKRFDAYPGYVTTLMGPKASDEELKAVQKQILQE
ncbi:MAG: HIT domain-containing protein [Candidatus Micrarchaeota archaeon]|nr:HIT domain-containing protein [Candidatus Micrarchaeota archaeon]MDE1847686.1 HIT domain-containing protein [Candidatus Micrarchaeota archaeon]MDE1864507.1 HIT domain-containing protein [Candidatus Micrarchaeota archaeon]